MNGVNVIVPAMYTRAVTVAFSCQAPGINVKNMRLLVVESRRNTSRDLAADLHGAGFSVNVCLNEESARFLVETEDFDTVIISFLDAPNAKLATLKRCRAVGRDMAIIALMAQNDPLLSIEILNAGADDCVVHSIHREELIARARAIIRRKSGYAGPLIETGKLKIDTSRMRISLDNRNIRLSRLEFQLLCYLLHHRGRIVSEVELAERLYFNRVDPPRGGVAGVIERLRKKLGSALIECRRGLGYYMP